MLGVPIVSGVLSPKRIPERGDMTTSRQQSLSHLLVFSICVSQHVFLMMGADTFQRATISIRDGGGCVGGEQDVTRWLQITL